MKLIYLLLCINVLFANGSNNIVKTSELELLLFKVGFKSLLSDVDDTKNNSTVNTEDIKNLKSKIEIIMNEIYKDKRVIKTNESTGNMIKTDEFVSLKKEISSLRAEVLKLKALKPKEKELKVKGNSYRVKGSNVKIFSKSIISEEFVIERAKANTYLNIKSCNKYDWCKLKDNKGFIPKYYLDYD